MNEGAKNANDEMFRRAVSGNFATVINKLQRVIELLEAQAAQQSVQSDGACSCPDDGNLQINSDFVCAVCHKTPRR